ncbi:unnamed protein product [Meloidogyne enterolobii]|uniref:Uncharacterized protein n=1 Tax=Meloidogyne enterolobii TaxID=390850 RepID=A0ACB0YU88_MELEN
MFINKLQLIFVIIFFTFLCCYEIDACIQEYGKNGYTHKCDPTRKATNCCAGLKCTAATGWKCVKTSG